MYKSIEQNTGSRETKARMFIAMIVTPGDEVESGIQRRVRFMTQTGSQRQ